MPRVPGSVDMTTTRDGREPRRSVSGEPRTDCASGGAGSGSLDEQFRRCLVDPTGADASRSHRYLPSELRFWLNFCEAGLPTLASRAGQAADMPFLPLR